MSVFNSPPPNYSIEDITQLVEMQYGLIIQAEVLYSERDQNFLCSDSEKKFILKISNTDEDKNVLEMQNECMLHIHRVDPSLLTPLPIDEIKEYKGSYVRLVEYLEGQFLMDIDHHEELLTELGSFLGRLRTAMDGFDHAAGHRPFEWDIRFIDFIKDHKHTLDDNESLVDYFIHLYEKHVLPYENDLRKSMNHNDANTHNVMVNGRGEISGIIDFGDMIHTFTACEPAVCMAYIALEKNDPLADIQEVLKGFHDRYALTELELSKVVYLMCVRSCITLTMAAYRMKLFPENNYISVDNNQAFHFLSRMKNEDLESWSNALVDYCGA